MIDANTMDLINVFLSVNRHFSNGNDIQDENFELQKLISVSILNNIILSKKIFKKNYMIGKFLEKNFSMSLSKYALTSRTMITGKVTRYIYGLKSSDELIEFLNALYNILKKLRDNKDIFDNDIYEVIMGMKI